MTVCHGSGGNTPVVPCLCRPEEDPFPFCRLTNLLENGTVDGRIVAALDNERELCCLEHGFNRLPYPGDIREISFPGARQVQPDQVRLILPISMGDPLGRIMDPVAYETGGSSRPEFRIIGEFVSNKRSVAGRRDADIREIFFPPYGNRMAPGPAILCRRTDHQFADPAGPFR